MRNSKKRFLPLILGVISLLFLIGMFLFVPPATSFSLIFFSISSSTVFLLLVALTAYLLPRFFLKSKRHGLLICLFITLYLIFRLWGLTHPFFAFLLLALFLTLELLFTRKQS